MVFFCAVSRSEQPCQGFVLDGICVENVSEAPFWVKTACPGTHQNNQKWWFNPAWIAVLACRNSRGQTAGDYTSGRRFDEIRRLCTILVQNPNQGADYCRTV